MAAPSNRLIRICLYGRHIGCPRRHSYQPVSRAGERLHSGGVRSIARRALNLLNAPQVNAKLPTPLIMSTKIDMPITTHLYPPDDKKK